MTKLIAKTEIQSRRKARIRAKIKGTPERPRLAVYKSNMYLYAQIIDDTKGETLCAITSRQVKGATPKERAKAMGSELAKEAQKKDIKAVVFDRGGFAYTGNIKEIATGAREA